MFPKGRGFAMAAVVALLAILAVFGTALVIMSTTQHAGSTLDMQGVRAYYAARGGLEWGMYHVLRTGFGGCDGAGGINGKTVAYGGNLSDFRVTLACTFTTHEEGGANMRVFSIVATACNQTACPAGAPLPAFYVERQLRVTVGSN